MATERATLAALIADLAQGRTTSTALVVASLQRIAAAGGDGAHAFVRIYEKPALQAAAACDRRIASGASYPPLTGIPLSIKDLFDVPGEPTTAGSQVLRDAPAAAHEAGAVRRLRAAGAVILGKTNMTEFAYSTLGLNPHYGTPVNPFDAARVPGGSSSGAAASVAYGYCAAAIGSDTAGSVRIPAAYCGLIGFKPTQRRIPRDGLLPLSPSLDSIGPIAVSTRCCALLDAVMADTPAVDARRSPSQPVTLAIPDTLLEALDPAVARAFERTLSRLSRAGMRLVQTHFDALDRLAELEQLGGLIGYEAHAWHESLLERAADQYDPRVRARLQSAAAMSETDYRSALKLRAEAIGSFRQAMRGFGAALAPTVSRVPPRFDQLTRYEDYVRINAEIRRNPLIANLLDGCALSLPCQDAGELPVGAMLIGCGDNDREILALGALVEAILRD